MDIHFADFCFDSEKLTLYKNGELVALKRNQALLLRFFLQHTQDIHSKDTIMDVVWQGKVVSEQVVFQTISQLRTILGSDAIKTYSRQGYRWQLAIVQPGSEIAIQQQQAQNKDWLKPGVLLAASLLLVCAVVWLIPRQENVDSQIDYQLLNGQQNQSATDIFQRVLSQDNSFAFRGNVSDVSVSQAFNTPQLIWKQQGLPQQQWLFWAKDYPAEQGTFLHYAMARGKVFWQGYAFAKKGESLNQVLANKLQQLKAIGLFEESLQQVGLAELMAMHKLAEDNPQILLRLAEQYINMQQQDVALIYLQRVLADDTYAASPDRANAHWMIGKIYKMREQHLQADNSLQTMSQILRNTPLWELRLHQIKTRAWLAYGKTDYRTMYQTLEQGLDLTQQQAEPLIPFKLHLLYSTLAQKVGDDVKKYQHLNQAQALLLKHNLHQSNQVAVLYHFALFTEDNQKAIPYLQRILTLPRSSENYWFREQAFELLAEHYFEQEDYIRASELFARQPDDPRSLFLKGKMLLLQQQQQRAIHELEQSFELARLNYDDQTALQAALALYQLSLAKPKQQAEYLAYIQSNAGNEWLTQHQIELAEQ